MHRLVTGRSSAYEALTLLTSKWRVDVLQALNERPLRFKALERRLEPIARKVLTQTLRAMERDGLVVRSTLSPHVMRPRHVEYALSAMGVALRELLIALQQWSERHMPVVLDARAAFDSRESRCRLCADLAHGGDELSAPSEDRRRGITPQRDD